MARLIAIEWDSTEARIVVGRARGDELVIEQARAIALSRTGQGSDEGEMGPQLAAAVGQLHLGRGDVLVGVGRANIELKKMQLPPAPDEELPDMVRFQGMRQFTTIADDWPLDFVTLARSSSGVEVLAAAISPTLVEQIRGACEVCELTPKRLVLRPFAAASLLMHARREDRRCQLVVDILATEADLFVLADGNVAFMRTVRLPHGDTGAATQVPALVGEIRRTIPAAQSQMAGKRIESIVIFGDDASHSELRNAITSQLSLAVETFNPFSAVQYSRELSESPPVNLGRYAPLLGMMLDEAGAAPHTIDFLHPRKRPETKSRRERYLLATTAVLAGVCLATLGVKFYLDAQDRKIATLTSELESAKKGVTEAAQRETDVGQVDQFLQGDVSWLHELELLSERLPAAQDAIVTTFNATVQANAESRVTLEGLAKSPAHVEALEINLRDDDHRVIGRTASQDAARSDYPWRFSETVVIRPGAGLRDRSRTDASEGARDSEPTRTESSPSDAPAPVEDVEPQEPADQEPDGTPERQPDTTLTADRTDGSSS